MICTGSIRRPISSFEIGFLVRLLLVLHAKVGVDIRCLADVRNSGAGVAVLVSAYLVTGLWGFLFASAVLLAMVVYNQDLEDLPARISALAKGSIL